ncbi:toll/interleukin-1 receptor domain-containing protein [Candidatus Albibeggiatoa sp. nov. NOAA]|uniref:toll/interleukin-1 receptor domain-containing protein n=1 Tax=Candidatus Albibeggiatoa sp. nov. NOAA TaxID=3162724 RepID=UPI003301ABA7|nr:TIR domain-containing protein [Thiotrichaceae bacterium]
MAVSTAFQNDIFISYASVDNQPLFGAEYGWVSTLVGHLQAILSQQTGQEYKLWIDYKDLQHHQPAPQQIEQAIDNSACFVLVLSTAYAANPDCLQQLQRFIAQHSRQAIFIIEKESIPKPSLLSDFIGYPFWEQNPQTQRTRTLGVPVLIPEKDGMYYQQVTELGQHLIQQLSVTQPVVSPEPEPVAPLNPTTPATSIQTPKVFISYSWDSESHKQNVLAFANQLIKQGIDVALDQFEQFPSQGWANWMLDQIEECDFVLLVCTETYNRRVRRKEDGRGKGVTWEGTIMTDVLYDDFHQNTRFIPVVFSVEDMAHVPRFLGSVSRFVVTTKEGYKDLYRYLTEQPAIKKPELGQVQALDTEQPVQTLNFNFD